MSFGTAFDPTGLRVLLAPVNSPLIGSTLCNFTGTLYPVFATYRALEFRADKPRDAAAVSRDVSRSAPPGQQARDAEMRRWACYWAVFGTFRFFEGFMDPTLFWVPYYYPTKMAVLLWLMLPQFKGANLMYERFLKPVLHRYEPKIEIILAELKKHDWMVESLKPYLRTLFATILLTQRSIADFFKWFFSPTEEPVPNIEDSDKKDEITGV